MSDGTNIYNRLLGYILWVNHRGSDTPERVYVMKGSLIGEKKYKVTLRNVKLFIEELRAKDPTITSVMIDKLSRCGLMTWDDNDTTENRKAD